MIKLTRIDDRLVHGQVAFTWVTALGIDCLVVANDKVAKDDFQKMAMGLAKPPTAKLLILTIADAVTFLNNIKSKNLKILLLINCIKDAFTLSEEVPEIQSVNFGGIRTKDGSKLISKAIAVSDDDITIIKQMAEKGLELEIRQVPTDKKQLVQNLI
jgi:PTS system mannose-specific IIB component/fructoselysine and glucoselysine-specific PTS system IIB component